MKEKEFEDKLEKNLEIIEPGLSLIERQKRVNTGVIDLFCKDRNGKYVIVEIKKKPNTMVIAQLAKYNMTLIKSGIPKKRLRTILVAQELPKAIKEICEFFNFEIKNLYKKERIEKNPKRFKINNMNTSIFVKTLGNSSKAKIMGYLITCKGLPVHQSDVIRNSKVSKVTVMKIWNEMIKNGLLEYDRTIGRAKLYKLNTKNPSVKKLIELYNICLEQEAEEGMKEAKVKISA